jgi:hypothetical protein
VHAEGTEDAGHLRQLAWGADTDRAVTLGRDPLDAAEPLGPGTEPRQHLLVHLLGHGEERRVRGHLAAVEVGQVAGEPGPQLQRLHQRHESSSRPARAQLARATEP